MSPAGFGAEDNRAFAWALGASIALHAAFAPLLSGGAASARRTVEIGITRGVRLAGSPKREVASRTVTAPRLSAPARPLPVPDTEPARDSARSVEPKEQPGPSAVGTEEPAGGTTGDAAAAELTRLPALLNAAELLSNLRRLYPPEEKRAGREGRVLLEIHLDEAGVVTEVAIAETGGPAFDEAARKVAQRLRFAPARTSAGAVAVKFRQAIEFKLEE